MGLTTFQQQLLDVLHSDYPGVRRISKANQGRRYVDGGEAEYPGQLCEAVVYASRNNRPLILPHMPYWAADWGNSDPGASNYWNPREPHRIYSGWVQMKSPLQFMKHGLHVNLFSSRTTAHDLREGKITPRKAFENRFGDSRVKERILERAACGTSYRGWGWWNPFNRTHVFVPFIVPAEGHLLSKLLDEERRRAERGDEDPEKSMRVTYEAGDFIAEVPSISMDHYYLIPVTPMPVGDDFYTEWVQLDPRCNCEWSDYRHLRSRRLRAGTDGWELMQKFRNPEVGYCFHGWAALEASENYSGRARIGLKARFPRPTRISNELETLSTRTLVVSGSGKTRRKRRPTKTEINIILGWLHAYKPPEWLYDIHEN